MAMPFCIRAHPSSLMWLQSGRDDQHAQQIAEALLGQTAIPAVRPSSSCWTSSPATSGGSTSPCPCSSSPGAASGAWSSSWRRPSAPSCYSNFADELGESTIGDLPGVLPAPTVNASAPWGGSPSLPVRARLSSWSRRATLIGAGAGTQDDIVTASKQAHGLGLFIRSLVGLHRAAATAAFDALTTRRTEPSRRMHSSSSPPSTRYCKVAVLRLDRSRGWGPKMCAMRRACLV